MLNSLQLWNFTSGTPLSEEVSERYFVLKTCQRTLVLSFEDRPFEDDALKGQEAYLYLLETICGLKSKLIGENEIVGQFKDAYKLYSQSSAKNTNLLLILEKLFKDAKDIRTQYLIGISQKTYASLTRKHMIQRAHATEIVVIGSGALAEDLINQFKKKAKVSICARNSERVRELAAQHGLKIIPWSNRISLVNHAYIANTVGAKEVLFNESFFADWAGKHSQRLFVDLGSPSVIQTDLVFEEGVVRLSDIFNEGAIVEEQKLQQIHLARVAMATITEKRHSLLQQKLSAKKALLTPQTTAAVRYL
jgi:glutamyl-tRNA reductase